MQGPLLQTMRKTAQLARRLITALLATVICLGLCEVALRLVGFRAIYDVYSRPELFWRKDPLLGWSHLPGSDGVFVGPRPFPVEFRGHVHINSLGLRGRELEVLPSDGLRVLVLGDSVVAGFEVDEEKTFVSILEPELTLDLGRPVQVINGGVRGYGTDQAYLYFRDRGRQLRPNLVVFVAANNDPEDNTTLHRARRPFGKPAFSLTASNDLQLLGSPVPEYPFCSEVRLDAQFRPVQIGTGSQRVLCRLQTNLSDHSALFTFATLRIQQNPELVHHLFRLSSPSAENVLTTSPGGPSRISPGGRLTTKLIQEMASLARHEGAGFLLAIYDYDLDALDREALESSGVQISLLNKASENMSLKSLQWKNDGHYNEAGHRRVADTLRPVLAQQLREVAAHRRAGGP